MNKTYSIYVDGEEMGYNWSSKESAEKELEFLKRFDISPDAICEIKEVNHTLEPCCENEDRSFNGGCKNCGDPCF